MLISRKTSIPAVTVTAAREPTDQEEPVFCTDCGEPVLLGPHADPSECREALLARSRQLEGALRVCADAAGPVAGLVRAVREAVRAADAGRGRLPDDVLAELRYRLAYVQRDPFPFWTRADGPATRGLGR